MVFTSIELVYHSKDSHNIMGEIEVHIEVKIYITLIDMCV